MKRSPNLFLVPAALLLLASAGLRFIPEANLRWAPLLLIFGSGFLLTGLRLKRRNQQENESKQP